LSGVWGASYTFLKTIRGDRLEALYLLTVTTGLRRGEMLGLKWTDIDLEKGTVLVSRSLDTLYGPATENAPKRAAGLPPYNFQDLRRSNATFLVLLEVHPRVAQHWMGHSSITTTMNIYSQAPDELQEKAAKLMGELFFGAEEESEDVP
jgi:integrase